MKPKENTNKKLILALAISLFTMSVIVISCSSPSEKVENAQDNLVKANQDLDKANEEYLSDIENCKKEAAEKTAANEKSIAEFKARVENEKKEVKKEYYDKIAKLEEKNNDIKSRMADYKAEGKEKWEIFKTEFSRDMNELGTAFKDLTVKNVK
jgi:hypothetical protein